MTTELKSERFQMMVEPSVVRKIDDFRFGQRIESRSEAERRLLMRGLDAETKTATEGKPGSTTSIAVEA